MQTMNMTVYILIAVTAFASFSFGYLLCGLLSRSKRLSEMSITNNHEIICVCDTCQIMKRYFAESEKMARIKAIEDGWRMCAGGEYCGGKCRPATGGKRVSQMCETMR